MREMVTPQQKSTAWKQVSLSLVKDSLTVLNIKRLMESEMFYLSHSNCQNMNNSSKQAWKLWWYFQVVACCQSHTFTCQTGMCIVSYFVRVFKPMWKKTLLNFGSVLCTSCPTVLILSLIFCAVICTGIHRSTRMNIKKTFVTTWNKTHWDAMPSKVCAPWNISICQTIYPEEIPICTMPQSWSIIKPLIVFLLFNLHVIDTRSIIQTQTW
jgi:hypothetical protein